MPETHSRRKRVVYIIGRFPALTMTFITREILEAKRTGADLVLVSIRRSPPFEMCPEVEALAGETRYLLPVVWPKFLASVVYYLATRPWVFVSTLIYLLSRPHPSLGARFKTLIHFAEGVHAAGLIRGDKVDHIHAHFADRAATVALVASRLVDVEFSFTAHANDIYIAPELLTEKVEHAKFTTTCTAYNKSHLEKVTGHPVELIYHGLDLEQLDDPCGETHPETAPLILSVGRLTEKKGFPVLLEACARLKQEERSFRCEIVGDGPDLALLTQQIDTLGIGDRVALLGALSNAAVMQKYIEATIFTLPCVVAKNDDRDGIPNVMLEAMAHELPVVSTNVSGIPEVLHHEETGLMVESGQVDALTDALRRLLDDPEERQRLGENARDLVANRFDIRRNIGRLVELLES
jgi:glycosyltransferase involved in cell wall biosynthesis